ncbi:MAG TPA: DNA-processing protein DprA [Acidimicrobiales bacterium]|nr:DNA-processing protein DprA [Acidimicrobiales bacterium]
MTALPSAAYAVALASLPGITPRRLRELVAEGPEHAWQLVSTGHIAVGLATDKGEPARRARWKGAARSIDVERRWHEHVDAGLGVHVLGDTSFPAAFANDPASPAAIFTRGSIAAIGHRRAAIVGTRRCTHVGREIAIQLGRELADERIAVVSGLALGIDGAAHRGVLATNGAPPIAVVGSGLDVVYPKRHAALWAEVAERGVVISEAPLGTPPEAWRFPARNRLIAALSGAVVVVESHLSGGSLLTAQEAERRGVTVLAVPGTIRNPAASGCNALLADGGAILLRDVTDVLVALGLSSTKGQAALPLAEPDDREQATVRAAIPWVPPPTGDVIRRTGLPPSTVATLLHRLHDSGWLAKGEGGFWEREAR